MALLQNYSSAASRVNWSEFP